MKNIFGTYKLSIFFTIFSLLICCILNAQELNELTKEEDSIKSILKSAIHKLDNLEEIEKGVALAIVGEDYAERSNNKYLKGLAATTKALIDIKNHKIEDAKVNVEKAIIYLEEVSAQEEYALAYELLGVVNYYEGKEEQAIAAFFKAEYYCELIKDSVNLIDICFNLSNLYRRNKKWDKCIASALKSLKAIEATGIKKKNKSQLYSFIAESYISKGEYKLAKQNLQQALAVSTNQKNKGKVELRLANFYKKNKEKEKAFKYYELSIASYLEYLNKMKLSSGSVITLEKEKTNKDLVNSRMGLENDLFLEKIKFNKYFLFSSLLVILGLILLIIVQFKRVRLGTRTSTLLREKNLALLQEKNIAEEAVTLKSNFIDTITYELKYPLNVIRTVSYLLKEKKIHGKAVEYIDRLAESSKYLLDFINDVIAINLLKNKKTLKVNINKFKLQNTISDVVNLIDTSTTNNKIRIAISKNIPDYIYGDDIKLTQILMNLLVNANKFTYAGFIDLNIVLVDKTIENTKVLFEIKDTGIGIEKEKTKIIFNDFYQGSIAINRNYGGTGLGLSIVEELLKLYKSEIKVVSELNKGTSFSFVIVFDNTDLNKEVIENTVVDRKNRILLVEDDLLIQELMKKRIVDMGLLCDVANNGLEAVNLSKIKNYDLVLMDIQMPVMDGYEATRQIRIFDKTIPIVALTGISQEKYKKEFKRAGIKTIVHKSTGPLGMSKIISNELKS